MIDPLTENDIKNLYTREGIVAVHETFLATLEVVNPDLCGAYKAVGRSALPSALMIELAPYVEDFIGKLFGITAEMTALQDKHHALAVLSRIKRQFVQRVAVRKYPAQSLPSVDVLTAQMKRLLGQDWTPLTFACAVSLWLEAEETHADALTWAGQYAAWATLTPEGQQKHAVDTLFKVPHKTYYERLLPDEIAMQRSRDGFSLTDLGLDRVDALDQTGYCIFCHHQHKDSCSKGMASKTPGERFAKNPLQISLTGCPLEEKISEMNEVKQQGYTVGALAIITIDNPMVAGTGHRICNDCMKACIYQKQEPVNVPGIESQILKDVLELPWGFEIYSLLTRWNPLNTARPVPEPNTGYAVLVVGMGPAGYTLAHHLMNDGHHVVGIDGTKIEPDPLTGVNALGVRTDFTPIRDITTLMDNLDDRITEGFGGVAEYGITVRWNKNYLRIIRLLLERRAAFTLCGGVRFGSTLTVDQAKEFGFDHIALCMGAGSPTLISMENSLAPGVRQASDFLMALQLTGAAKRKSLANLQIQLPAVVIGGGLTAIDTATELLAYYPRQVEKFWQRYQVLKQADTPVTWSPADAKIADTFLTHGEQIALERAQAAAEQRAPNFLPLLKAWGGVKVLYRRPFTESPSYRLNHEEVIKALEEGVEIAESVTPKRVIVDDNGHANALEDQTGHRWPARNILIAAGTKPNTQLCDDEPGYFTLDGQTFQAVDEAGQPITPEKTPKPAVAHVLLPSSPDAPTMSFFGDLHPSFAGNVVKAMASAKQGYPAITRVMTRMAPRVVLDSETVNTLLRPTVHAVHRLTPTIVEVVVKAPLAASSFQPGQFFRLQNYERLAPQQNGVRLVMEGLALTGAKAMPDQGLVSTIVLEMGGSSSLCDALKPGDPIVFMGPTGEPTALPANTTVLLVGGGLGNAVLFSIGQALRAQGSRVLYVAGYKTLKDRYKVEEIEAAADQVVWCCDEAPGFTATRSQDLTFVGNIVAALEQYATMCAEDFKNITHVLAIGSDGMMAAVARARHTVLNPYLNPQHQALGSINAPMQCMMKGICAQCLQRHINPITGEETIVYSCVNQDQPLDAVDFKSLSQRLGQNRAQEVLTAAYIQHIT